MSDTPDYATMSLDDVIKDMNARKEAKAGNPHDNSPFFRQNTKQNGRNRPFTPTFMKRVKRNNLATNLSRKRVQQAKRTLDLRNRIIHLRATREGLDLRWKLVANMIAKLRQQENRFSVAPRFHPYGTSIPLQSDSVPAPPRVSRASLSTIEKLVGRLPPWMAPTMPAQPRVHQQYHPNGAGPIRTRPHMHHSPVPGLCSSYAACHPAPTHVPCPSIHSGCTTPHSHCQIPPLVFEQPPPTYREAPHYVTNEIDQVDVKYISIQVPNEQSDSAPVKRTLNERFSY